MNATKIWTINDIKTAVLVRGSHWFDPDTMRFFKTRVLEGVYQGAGGVYFVTSEKGPSEARKYSVRKFTPDTADISTVGEFNEMTRAQAIKAAKIAAGAGLVAHMEEFVPVSVAEQFLADLLAHGCKATREQSRNLRSFATRHHALMEDYCNGRAIYDAEGEPLKPLARIRGSIEATAKAIGCAGVKFSGDPRGCTVKLIFADGETNDFGKEGWIIPTLER
jgi:hypothetical protein